MKRAVLMMCAALMLGACAHWPINPALPDPKNVNPKHGYRFGNITAPALKDGTMFIVSFSGGGTRAAALAYGVLEKLHDTSIRDGNMLDAVDVVSSISGGSFTAAHYALYGYAGLPRLRERFLDQPKTQLRLALSTLNPYNAFRLLSPRYSRIDLAAEYFDRLLFDCATYEKMPRTAPYTMINASELDIGSVFTFVQEQFDPICSDLDKVPVARAVAASSAFPVLLTPITFQSYAGPQCGYRPGLWFDLSGNDLLLNPRRIRYRSELVALMNKDRRFLHLVDGGVADNIGLRGPYQAIISSDTLQMPDDEVREFDVPTMINNGEIQRVVVIAVNARTVNELSHDRRASTPTVIPVVAKISGSPMANYSFETVTLVQETFDALNKQNPGVHYHFVEVAFNYLPVNEQAEFNSMGTNYALSKADVAKVIDAAKRILTQSPPFQEVVSAMQ
jgi:predicted acylesterase/phospholipase RssA